MKVTKESIIYCVLLITLLSTIACSSSRKVIYNNDPVTAQICEHKAEQNINALISDIVSYPEKSEDIRSFLLFDIDYSCLNKDSLETLLEYSKRDPLLYKGMEAIIISIDQKNQDFASTIENSKRYETYRDLLRYYLLYDKHDSIVSYRDICDYRKMSQYDKILEQGYYYIQLAFENEAYLILEKANLSNIFAYYKNYSDEYTFLDPLLTKSIVENISKYDYKHIRTLNNLAFGTNIYGNINSVYEKKRKDQYPYVKSAIQKQKKNEDLLIAELKKQIKQSLDIYVSEHIGSIIRQCGQQSYSSSYEDVDNKFYQILNQNIDFEEMKRTVASSMSVLLENINKSRNQFYYQLTGNNYQNGGGLIVLDGISSSRSLSNKFDLSGLYKIASIQNESDPVGTAIGVGGFLLGLVSGPLGWAATAASAIHSYDKGKSDANREGTALREFANKFLKTLKQQQNAMVDDYLKKLNSVETKSFSKYTNDIYEKY